MLFRGDGPGHEERAAIVTQFVGKVRETIDHSTMGRDRRYLGGRILSRVDKQAAMGLDVQRMHDAGVDMFHFLERTWSQPRTTGIPNPGSKARLHRIRDGRIILVHNPNSQTSHPNTRPQASCQRNPLSVWISDDDMQSWRYKRELTDFPGMLAYPDGVLHEEGDMLHIVFDYNRHDVIYWGADLAM